MYLSGHTVIWTLIDPQAFKWPGFIYMYISFSTSGNTAYAPFAMRIFYFFKSQLLVPAGMNAAVICHSCGFVLLHLSSVAAFLWFVLCFRFCCCIVWFDDLGCVWWFVFCRWASWSAVTVCCCCAFIFAMNLPLQHFCVCRYVFLICRCASVLVVVLYASRRVLWFAIAKKTTLLWLRCCAL